MVPRITGDLIISSEFKVKSMSKSTYRRNMKADWPNYNANQGKTKKQNYADLRNYFIGVAVLAIIAIALSIAAFIK